jgi:hypothetical protein
MPVAFLITGVAAVAIIIAILAVLVLGVVYLVRIMAHGAEKIAHIGDHHDSH